jgi:excisionase family DNA binding protein
MAVKSTGDNDEILTTRQVADVLKIHQATVRRLARSGVIPGWRVGGIGSWRFLKSEILKHLVKRNK